MIPIYRISYTKIKKFLKIFSVFFSGCFEGENVMLTSPLRTVKRESAVPLSCSERYFISISALVNQKVETPFLNPRGKPDFND